MSFLFRGGLAPAFTAAFAGTGFTALLTATAAAFLPAFVRLVNRGPGATCRFFAALAALLVALLNVFCFSFLFRCVFLFASSCHKSLPPPTKRTTEPYWIH